MKKGVPIFALIESGLTLLYYLPIWWIIPWNTETIKITFIDIDIIIFPLSLITFLLSVIYILVMQFTKKRLKIYYIILCLLALAMFLPFLYYTAIIFLFDIGFPRQH